MAKQKKPPGCLGGCLGVVVLAVAAFVIIFVVLMSLDPETLENLSSDSSDAQEETNSVLDKYQHEEIDGVDVFTTYLRIATSANTMMNSFSYNSTNLLKEVHQDIENGAVFRLASDVSDDYGNSSKQIVSTVWYSQETIERINYDNWPRLDASGLYDTADGVILHYALNQEVDLNRKTAGEGAPNIYYDSIGREIEFE